MRDALQGRRLVVAGTDAPGIAICPECNGVVELRCRRNGQEKPTWFYRHRQRESPDCSRRTNQLKW